MALDATIVLEVRTAGADTNGGGYKPGSSGSDFSKQDAAQYALTNGTADGSATILTVSAASDMVGNLVYVAGGTGSITGTWKEILSVSVGVSITVDSATGLTAGTGVTLNVGGALLTWGIAASIAIQTAGIDVWVKAGTYSMTSTTANVAGGRVNLTVGGASAANPAKWEGYTTVRGDGGVPLLQASGAISSFAMFTVGAAHTIVRSLRVDGASKTTSRGFSNGNINDVRYDYCSGINCTNGAFSTGNARNILFRCYATGCSSVAAFNNANSAVLIQCEAFDNTFVGFLATGNATYIYCLAYRNRGSSSVHGFSTTTTGSVSFIGCVAFYNQGSGFDLGIAGFHHVQNCIAYSNGVYGIACVSSMLLAMVYNCAFGANTSGPTSNLNTSGTDQQVFNTVTLTGDPFTNASTSTAGASDFSLNNTAGAGAACRAAGMPGTFPQATAAGYLDIGAVQHADPASGGGLIRHPGMSGGLNG